MLLGHLCLSLSARYACTNVMDDIESAITAGSQAIELVPAGHPYLTVLYNSLAGCLLRHSSRTGSSDSLSRAVDMFRKTIEFTPDGHPHLSSHYGNLGEALSLHFERYQTSDNFEAAVQALNAKMNAVDAESDDEDDESTRFSPKEAFELIQRLENISNHLPLPENVHLLSFQRDMRLIRTNLRHEITSSMLQPTLMDVWRAGGASKQ